jgi:hypothetical protein
LSALQEERMPRNNWFVNVSLRTVEWSLRMQWRKPGHTSTQVGLTALANSQDTERWRSESMGLSVVYDRHRVTRPSELVLQRQPNIHGPSHARH